jgi:NitT/TauT family transport system substrate-binding protein
MAYLFTNPPELGRTKVSFDTAGSVDVLLPKLLKGDIDIGILPPNIAAKLYALDHNSIVVGAIVGNGMITLVTRDPSIKSIRDLKGKTVSVVGQGATPEYVLRTLIAKAGLDSSAITLDFSIPATEIAPALISNKIGYALVPEPFATVAVINGANGGVPVRRALFLQDIWISESLGSDFPMTLCVIRKQYADAYPETVRAFLSAYRKSISWTIANPSEAGKMVEASGLGLKAAVAEKSIPFTNFVYVPALEGRKSIESLLSIFLSFSPESVGGKLPDDGFYFR